jgi:hypothetical protein
MNLDVYADLFDSDLKLGGRQCGGGFKMWPQQPNSPYVVSLWLRVASRSRIFNMQLYTDQWSGLLPVIRLNLDGLAEFRSQQSVGTRNCPP